MAKKKKVKVYRENREPKPVLSKKEQREHSAILKWESTRQMGKWRYIFVKGTLYWSLMTTGIYVILTLALTKFFINQEILLYFLKMFIIFLAVGTAFGLGSWEWSELKYKKYQEKRDENLKE